MTADNRPIFLIKQKHVKQSDCHEIRLTDRHMELDFYDTNHDKVQNQQQSELKLCHCLKQVLHLLSDEDFDTITISDKWHGNM
jgi:hypothetical protein